MKLKKKTGRKTTREIEARLKQLSKEEETMRRRLNTLECVVVATPAMLQEQKLQNWNTLPAEPGIRRTKTAALTRVQQAQLRQARIRQALFALLLLAILSVFAVWFYHQATTHRLLQP